MFDNVSVLLLITMFVAPVATGLVILCFVKRDMDRCYPESDMGVPDGDLQFRQDIDLLDKERFP